MFLIEHLDAVVEQYKIEDIDERIKETEKVYYGKKYMIHTFGFFYQNPQTRTIYTIRDMCSIGFLSLIVTK